MDQELDLAQLTADEYQARVADAVDWVSDQGGIIWLAENGRRVAAVVPVDVAEHHEQMIEQVLRTPVAGRHHKVRFPDVTVQLSGQDSSAGAIIAAVLREMREAGRSDREMDDLTAAILGCEGYGEVLKLVTQTVNVR